MRDDQRRFLLEEFQGFVSECRQDTEPDGGLSTGTVSLIDRLDQTIAWLDGDHDTPGSAVRDLLEERLAGFEDGTDFRKLAYEHDALVAAIEEL